MKALPDPENVSSDQSLWDAQDVARYLKVSRSWVYHQAEAGLLPHLRVGALLRFDPDTIRAYTKGSTVRSKIVPFPPRSQ
jgi:excisionase family DNA binding protein